MSHRNARTFVHIWRLLMEHAGTQCTGWAPIMSCVSYRGPGWDHCHKSKYWSLSKTLSCTTPSPADYGWFSVVLTTPFSEDVQAELQQSSAVQPHQQQHNYNYHCSDRTAILQYFRQERESQAGGLFYVCREGLNLIKLTIALIWKHFSKQVHSENLLLRLAKFCMFSKEYHCS